MTTETQNLPARQDQRRGQSLACQASSPADIVATLGANLALVRPVGMNDAAAEEWLTVAATTLADIPLRDLKNAASEARLTCTHHGQIVPTIRKLADQISASRASINAICEPMTRPRQITNYWRPVGDEIEQIKRQVAEQIAAEDERRGR